MGDIMFSWKVESRAQSRMLIQTRRCSGESLHMTHQLNTRTHTHLYEGLEQPLSEGPEGTSIFWGFVLGL